MKKVTIIDYGMGNLLSICRAMENLETSVSLSSSSKDLVNADYVILPGVGAFPSGMDELKERGFIDAISEFVLRERPFLGICLGMQMLFTSSEELKYSNGLNLIDGRVIKLPKRNVNHTLNKIPHVGWAQLFHENESKWDKSVLHDQKQRVYVYFVHSFFPSKINETHILAYSKFGDMKFGSVVQKDNIIGMQYHPEKSGEQGIKMLKHLLDQ